jgi:hypothetical protein
MPKCGCVSNVMQRLAIHPVMPEADPRPFKVARTNGHDQVVAARHVGGVGKVDLRSARNAVAICPP